METCKEKKKKKKNSITAKIHDNEMIYFLVE